MPSKMPRPCRASGCAGKTTERHGYCESHAHLAVGWRERRKGQAGRGGRPWRRLREQVMRRDRYLCQSCLRADRATPAVEVDHIVPRANGGTDAPSNLEAICVTCHKTKTARESLRHRQEGGGGSKV